MEGLEFRKMDRLSGAANANAKANANWWLKGEDDWQEKEEQQKEKDE